MRHIVVAKFGGTSVADADQFRKIADIIRENPERRFIVVSEWKLAVIVIIG